MAPLEYIAASDIFRLRFVKQFYKCVDFKKLFVKQFFEIYTFYRNLLSLFKSTRNNKIRYTIITATDFVDLYRAVCYIEKVHKGLDGSK